MRINLRQGFEDESPLVQSGMGDGEFRQVNGLLADQENIDVQRSRLMRCGSSPPELVFDALKLTEQLHRLYRRDYAHDHVQEVRLRGGRPDGRGFVETRCHRDTVSRRLNPIQNCMPCIPKRRPSVAQVGSKGECDPLPIVRALATFVRHCAAQFDTVT